MYRSASGATPGPMPKPVTTFTRSFASKDNGCRCAVIGPLRGKALKRPAPVCWGTAAGELSARNSLATAPVGSLRISCATF
jgi:hypothetical protein